MQEMTLISDIKQTIRAQINKGKTKFIIFPYGEVGMKFEYILRCVFNITADIILDNNMPYNSNIKPVSYLGEINTTDYIVFLASANPELYEELMANLTEYVPSENIVVLMTMRQYLAKRAVESRFVTSIGKYSYGPLCRNHLCIKSIGSFCSFAVGVDVVENHDMQYLTTHPMIYYGQHFEDEAIPMTEFWYAPWFFEGVQPRSDAAKTIKRTTIGNDVWLGRNVIITNGANIGNGVIAGAGAVITKDVPDYAVVVGVPARIIRYRYTPEQIEALNRIQWWDWTDDEIRERYDDFYLPIERFIEKYDVFRG